MLNRRPRPLAPADTDFASTAGELAPVLDPVALARLAELDPSGQSKLVERVLKAFQSSAARLLPQLDAASASADRPGIRLVAHTLKSSSASIGAMQLSNLCAHIENQIRLEASDDLRPDIAAMRAALEQALKAI
ncbi:MAG TPA: Hpt domain-containing protein, partial [Burkholderiaceae bacterium]|nr:Hpt domain-containing protein [Burkholderiaceae bacterium]